MGRNSGIPWEEIYKEQWRDIAGWTGYQVSDLGRVRHSDAGGWWLLSQGRYKGHKKFCVLSSHGKHFTVMVDRLVMEVFVGARRGRRIIHLNHIMEDNALDNLKYANRKEYNQWLGEHFKAIGRTKESDMKAARAQRRAEKYQRNYGAAQLWLSGKMLLRDAARTIGISESALSYWIKRNNIKKESVNV